MAEKKQVHLRESEYRCELCEQKVDTLMFKCVDCDIYICPNCTKGHKKVTLTKCHKIISNQFGPIRSSVTYCTAHPGEDFVYYCSSCEKLVCIDCVRQDHDGQKHIKMKINEVSDHKQQKLNQKVMEIKRERIPQINAKIQENENLKTENKMVTEKIRQDIQARNNQLIADLSQINNKTIAEAEQVMQKNDKTLDQSHNDLMKDKEQLEELYRKYDNVLKTGSSIDKIVAEQEIHSELGAMKTDFQITLNIPSFEQGISGTSSLQQMFGSLITKRKLALTKPSDKDFEPEDTARGSSPGSKPPDQKEFIIKVDIKRRFNHASRNISLISPILNQAAIFHCSRENNFQIINANGRVLRRVELNFIPNDIIHISDDIVMATDADSMKIYQLTREGKIFSEVSTAPYHPQHLSCSRDGGILVTLIEAGSYNNKEESHRFVRRYNKQFKKMADYEFDGKNRLFATPTKIAENINGDICVINKTSVNEGHVVVLDNQGRLKFKIKGRSGPQDAYDPESVKCDSVGHILISDYYGKKIDLLKRNGQWVQHLMMDDKVCPTAMGISSQGLLWVGCKNGLVFVVKYLH